MSVFNALRSVAFTVLLVLVTLALSILLLPALLLPQRALVLVVSAIYGGAVSWLERHVLGLRLEVRGLEHLPATHRFILAAKHQSAYETLKLPFMPQLHFPVIVLKKELLYLPGFGLYPHRLGLIPIDRASGPKALQQMTRGAQRAFTQGRALALFPEGTRKAPGAPPDYKPGIAKIYRDLSVPVVPMALNSGLFWGRNQFIKKPGTVVFEFLPPLPPGMPPLQMLAELEKRIEEATARLIREVQL